MHELNRAYSFATTKHNYILSMKDAGEGVWRVVESDGRKVRKQGLYYELYSGAYTEALNVFEKRWNDEFNLQSVETFALVKWLRDIGSLRIEPDTDKREFILSVQIKTPVVAGFYRNKFYISKELKSILGMMGLFENELKNLWRVDKLLLRFDRWFTGEVEMSENLGQRKSSFKLLDTETLAELSIQRSEFNPVGRSLSSPTIGSLIEAIDVEER